MPSAAHAIITSSTIVATEAAITYTRCEDIRLQVVRDYPALYIRAWDAIEAAGYTGADEINAAFELLPRDMYRTLTLVAPSGEMSECDSFITLAGCMTLALSRIDAFPADHAAAGFVQWLEHYAERVERHRAIRERVVPVAARAHLRLIAGGHS